MLAEKNREEFKREFSLSTTTKKTIIYVVWKSAAAKAVNSIGYWYFFSAAA